MNNVTSVLSYYKDPSFVLNQFHTVSEKEFLKRGEDQALVLFHQMAERVPAYKDFLKKQQIDPDSVKTIEDFRQVPLLDKDNYLRVYPRESLCWDGAFNSKRWVISVTSGSTGEPYYFPREDLQDWQYALLAELYLLNNFHIDKKSTLYIDSFAMGAWIGGLFTYQAIKMVAERGNYPLSIITPGIFKHEILNAVTKLGPEFDQVIIGGYPPFIKDLIDDGIKNGISWKDYDIHFIFSAEGFSESFRDYIGEKANLKNIYLDTLNHYGTVDLGTMAHETPLSIYLRRFALQNKKIYEGLFGNTIKLPTFAQYNPELYYFEEINGTLACSSYGGLPLVRYNLKDRGGVLSLQEVTKLFSDNGFDLDLLLKKEELSNVLFNLPFVYVFERDDFTVKLYGANIYPETIRKSLLKQQINESVTGKFTMSIELDGNKDQYLQVHIELKKDIEKSPELLAMIQETMVETLLNENSEYRSNFSQDPVRLKPQISLWDYEHEMYFKPGGKQKWTKK